MGTRILIDENESRAALYDSVTGFAFGPTFESRDVPGNEDSDEGLPENQAQNYCLLAIAKYGDPRKMNDKQHEQLLKEFLQRFDE